MVKNVEDLEMRPCIDSEFLKTIKQIC